MTYTTRLRHAGGLPRADQRLARDSTQTWGEWASLPIESGTYTLGFWASRSFTYAAFGETKSYRNTSVNDEAYVNFLVGTATMLMPETIISSKDNCNACHDTVYAHGGGREGYNTCILCHGTAGSEDRPRYVAPGAPATTGVSIEFRSMLHKIHMGEELDERPPRGQVVGFGSGAYPNNFGLNMYEEVAFPAMPDGVKNCEKCHGVGQRRLEGARPIATIPLQPAAMTLLVARRVRLLPRRDAPPRRHIQSQTSPAGVESCSDLPRTRRVRGRCAQAQDPLTAGRYRGSGADAFRPPAPRSRIVDDPADPASAVGPQAARPRAGRPASSRRRRGT